MPEAYIVSAVRSPVGRRNGGLAGIHPADLSAHVLRALAQRVGFDPAVVDDVIWGCVSQVGEQAINVGRTAVLGRAARGGAWRPLWTGSVAPRSRRCTSPPRGDVGQHDIVVAGGVESMTRVPIGPAASWAGAPSVGPTAATAGRVTGSPASTSPAARR